MKVEVKEPQEFNPIVLTITIESKEELNELYARLNAPTGSIKEYSFDKEMNIHGLRRFFNIIDQNANKLL